MALVAEFRDKYPHSSAGITPTPVSKTLDIAMSLL